MEQCGVCLQVVEEQAELGLDLAGCVGGEMLEGEQVEGGAALIGSFEAVVGGLEDGFGVWLGVGRLVGSVVYVLGLGDEGGGVGVGRTGGKSVEEEGLTQAEVAYSWCW